jgi:molybdopterin synthase sulfur carrier subunit
VSQITVLFFASLREQMGTAELAISADTIDDLYQQLRQVLGDDRTQVLQAGNIRIAVNQHLVDATTALQDGDEVAFLPPVTGG